MKLQTLFRLLQVIIFLVLLNNQVEGQNNAFIQSVIGGANGKTGCKNQKTIIRDQNSPNGDTPTELFVNMVKNAGYLATTYNVVTKDNYILSLYRISKPKSKKMNSNKTPVLIIHGLINSPVDWVVLDKNKALPYKLVEDGRDVWLGANRGTSMSKKHNSFSLKDPNYWNFSHIEFGLYDVPAFLDKIKTVTKQAQVFYIGHSLGTKQFFTWMSEFPGNCSRIKAMWALAPVAYVNHVSNPALKLIAAAIGPVGVGTTLIGNTEFFPESKPVQKLTAALCALNGGCAACQNFNYMIGGYGSDQVDENWQSIQMGHNPESTSTQNMIHEAQEVFFPNRFGYIDLGPVQNALKYGKKYALKPPQLKLERIQLNKACRIHMIYSDNDFFVNKLDLVKLKKKLGKALKSYNRVAYSKFNHLDFTWGKDADTMVYNTIIKEMNTYE